MTIFEAIKSNPVFVDTLDSSIDFVLSSRSINGMAIYTNASLKEVELATADLYMRMSLTEFKEGQLSVKYDIAKLEQRAIDIYRKYNDEKAKDYEPKPLNIGVTFE